LAKNEAADIAILKIDYRNSYYFRIADFNTANLGDKVYVLGFPLSNILGSDIRLTDGIVSAKSGMNSDKTYFQISAPVQPGNSGGPVLNTGFEVIGIAAAK
jgi:S1-C subfamily serine protease